MDNEKMNIGGGKGKKRRALPNPKGGFVRRR